MSVISKLQIVLEANTTAFDRNLAKVNDTLAKFSKSTGEMHKKMDKFTRVHRDALQGLQSAGQAAAVGLGATAYGIKGAVDEAVKFESAMAKVNKVMDFKTPEALQNMRKELEKLSATGTSTFVELAQIAEAGGQLGVLEKDLVPFVSMVSDMATAFDMSADVAGEAMAKLANVWNKPIQEMSQFGDMVNTVSNNTPAKASQIVEALGRIGGTAKSFGLSEQGAVSLTSAMIGLGKAPEVASKAVNHLVSTLATMDMADKNTSASLKQLGLDASEFGKLLKTDAEGALFSFLEAMNKLPKDEQIGFSVDMFGKNFYDDILALATAPELLTKIRDLLADSANYTGSMTKEAEVLSATTEGQIKKFQNNITILKASIGTAFLPALTSVMDKLTPIIGAISAWANENPKLLTTITAITAGALTLVATLGGLALAFTAVTGGIGSVIAMGKMVAVIVAPIINLLGFVKMFGSALAMLGFPVTAAVAGITALIAVSVLLYQNWDTVKAKASELWQALPQMANDAWLAVQSAWSGVVAWFGGVWDSIKQSFMAWLDGMPKPVQEMVANIGTIFSTIVDVAGAVWDGIANIAKSVWHAITEFVSYAIDKIKPIIKSVLEFFKNAWDGLVSIAKTVWQTIVDVVSGVFDTIFGVISTQLEAMKAIFMAGVTIFASIFNAGFEMVKTIFSTAFKVITAVLTGDMQGVKDAIKDGFQKAVDISKKLVGNIVDALKKLGKDLLQVGRDAMQGFINGVKAKMGEVLDTARDMANRVASTVKSALDIHSPSRVMKKLGVHTADGLAKGIQKGTPKAVKSAKKMADDIKKAIDDERINIAKSVYKLQQELKGNPYADFLTDIAFGKYGDAKKFLKSKDYAQILQLKEDEKRLQNLISIGDELDGLRESVRSFGMDEIERLEHAYKTSQKYYSATEDDMLEHIGLLKEIQNLEFGNKLDEMREQRNLIGKTEVEQLEYKLKYYREYRHISDVLKKAMIDEMKLKEFETLQSEKQLDLEKKLHILRGGTETSWLLKQSQFTEEQKKQIEQLTKQIELTEQLAELHEKLKDKSVFDVKDAVKSGSFGEGLGGVLEGIAGLANINAGAIENYAKIEEVFAEEKAKLEKARQVDLENEAYYYEQSKILAEQYADAKEKLLLNATQSTLGGITAITKSAFGEQSKLYRIILAFEKGVAISRSIIAIKTAMAMASANPFPANLGAMAMIASQTANIISAIKSVVMPVGQAHDGIMSVPKSGTWNLEKGERVLPRHTAKALDDKLDKIGTGGRPVNVVINNYSGEKTDVQQMPNGDMMVTIGKMISHTVDAKLNQRFIQARRQGGELYG